MTKKTRLSVAWSMTFYFAKFFTFLRSDISGEKNLFIGSYTTGAFVGEDPEL
jgi:hypothetical protein